MVVDNSVLLADFVTQLVDIFLLILTQVLSVFVVVGLGIIGADTENLGVEHGDKAAIKIEAPSPNGKASVLHTDKTWFDSKRSYIEAHDRINSNE